MDVVDICAVVAAMEKEIHRKSDEQNKGIFVQLEWESK